MNILNNNNQCPHKALGALDYIIDVHVDDPETKKRLRDQYNILRDYFYPVPTIQTMYPFLLEEMTCSHCGKKVTDINEAFFTNDSGMCLGCDHVMGEIDADKRSEYNDYISSCADANDMSVDDYEAEMGLR